jgi:hypothetical protein
MIGLAQAACSSSIAQKGATKKPPFIWLPVFGFRFSAKKTILINMLHNQSIYVAGGLGFTGALEDSEEVVELS